MPGVILNCLCGDRIKERARSGDPEAIKILIAWVGQDVPPALRLRLRDEKIRTIANAFRRDVPGISVRRMADVILAAAQRRRGAGLPSTVPPFDLLSPAELRSLKAEIDELLTWLRPDEMPKSRQLRSIIALGN
jgi:hypothetical protein